MKCEDVTVEACAKIKMRSCRMIVCICLGALIVLSVIQTSGYRRLAADQMPAIAMEMTPEYTHFAKGTTFSWVWLQTDRCENLTERQKIQLQALLGKRYSAVYVARKDIPEDKVRLGRYGVAYDDGFEFRFSVVSRGLFWVRVRHSDYEAAQGSSFGDHVYAWILGAWVKVYDHGLIVS